MDDTVYRRSVIEEIKSVYEWHEKVTEERLIEHINFLPSAQTGRKTGEWEIYIISMFDGEGCRCSECGFEGVPYWNYCPNCGAEMRGDKDA